MGSYKKSLTNLHFNMDPINVKKKVKRPKNFTCSAVPVELIFRTYWTYLCVLIILTMKMFFKANLTGLVFIITVVILYLTLINKSNLRNVGLRKLDPVVSASAFLNLQMWLFFMHSYSILEDTLKSASFKFIDKSSGKNLIL